MAVISDYITGKIVLTNGSVNFTGIDTGWLAADFKEGDTVFDVKDQNQWTAVIATIDTNTSGTFTNPWQGISGVYDYRMRYLADNSRVAAQARNLIELLGDGNLLSFASLEGSQGRIPIFTSPGNLELIDSSSLGGSGSGGTWDATVLLLSERAAYDDELSGFRVMVINNDSGRSALYEKVSDNSADWSSPIYFTGSQGAAGPAPNLSIGAVSSVPFGTGPSANIIGTSPNLILNMSLETGPMGDVTPEAEAARDAAIQAQLDAEAARDAASTSATNAATSATTALNAETGAIAARDEANLILGNLEGGNTGQYLVKNSPADFDYDWATPEGTGDVVGPVSSTLGNVAVFDSATGKLIADSGVSLDDKFNVPAGNTTQYIRGDGSLNVLDKSAVGLGNVDNTSDLAKPVSTATQTALNLKANGAITVTGTSGLTGGGNLTANRTISLNAASIASLAKADKAVQLRGSLGTVDLNTVLTEGIYYQGASANITVAKNYPVTGLRGVLYVMPEADGRVSQAYFSTDVRPVGTPLSKSRFFLRSYQPQSGGGIWSEWNEFASNDIATATSNGLMSNAQFTKLANIAPGAQVNTVTSVAGKTGAVTLAKGDVGLGNVDNTSDANKPISTATQTALNTKYNYNWIINGDFTVNQRGGVKKPANDVYGFDRWKGHVNGIEQIIEALPAGEYTLTWTGGGNGSFGGVTAVSPIKATVVAGNTSVVVPETATKVSLVRGDATAQDPWSPITVGEELALCQRYYQRVSELVFQQAATVSGGSMRITTLLPVVMRVNPTVTYSSAEGTGVSLVSSSIADRLFFAAFPTTGGLISVSGIKLDAEL